MAQRKGAMVLEGYGETGLLWRRVLVFVRLSRRQRQEGVAIRAMSWGLGMVGKAIKAVKGVGWCPSRHLFGNSSRRRHKFLIGKSL